MGPDTQLTQAVGEDGTKPEIGFHGSPGKKMKEGEWTKGIGKRETEVMKKIKHKRKREEIRKGINAKRGALVKWRMLKNHLVLTFLTPLQHLTTSFVIHELKKLTTSTTRHDSVNSISIVSPSRSLESILRLLINPPGSCSFISSGLYIDPHPQSGLLQFSPPFHS